MKKEAGITGVSLESCMNSNPRANMEQSNPVRRIAFFFPLFYGRWGVFFAGVSRGSEGLVMQKEGR